MTIKSTSKKIMMIDIDGVVCEHVPNEEPEKMAIAKPYRESIEKINSWFDAGHQICFFTARTDANREDTEAWLLRHQVKHHRVVYNKPRCVDGEEYHYIDDRPVRATTFKGHFTEFVAKSCDVLVFDGD